MHARQGGSFQSLCGNQTSRWRPAPTLYAAIEATAQACVCADELDFSECPIVLPPLLDVLLRTPLRGRVRKIDLSFGTDISNASILRFARECEALIELILPEHPPSTPDFYRSLAQARPTLKNLDLGYKLLESRGVPRKVLHAYAGGSVYCASKFAVNAFTQAMRHDLQDTALRIAHIAPGWVETEFSNGARVRPPVVAFSRQLASPLRATTGRSGCQGLSVAVAMAIAVARAGSAVARSNLLPLRGDGLEKKTW